jgi:hypothetical protein
MYLLFNFLTFLLAVAVIFGFFSIIITSPSFELPLTMLLGVILVPYLAHKIYRIILEHLDIDFIYAGHDITPEEVQTWRKFSHKLWIGIIITSVLAIFTWVAFFLLGGPFLNEVIYRAGKKVEVMRNAWMIAGSYACYIVGLLFTSISMGYCGILLRGWFFSTHASERFYNTLTAIKNLFLGFLGKITGIEIKHEEEQK